MALDETGKEWPVRDIVAAIEGIREIQSDTRDRMRELEVQIRELNPGLPPVLTSLTLDTPTLSQRLENALERIKELEEREKDREVLAYIDQEPRGGVYRQDHPIRNLFRELLERQPPLTIEEQEDVDAVVRAALRAQSAFRKEWSAPAWQGVVATPSIEYVRKLSAEYVRELREEDKLLELPIGFRTRALEHLEAAVDLMGGEHLPIGPARKAGIRIAVMSARAELEGTIVTPPEKRT